MIVSLIVGILATYKLTTDLVAQDGPFHAYKKFRAALQASGVDWLAEGADCPFCISFWAGLAVAVLLHGFTLETIAHGIAYSGACALLWHYIAVKYDVGAAELSGVIEDGESLD